MLTALLYGLAASSALVVGAAIGTRWDAPRKVTGVLLAFASGALISALAFELFEEAFALGGAVRSGLGLLAGAVAFVTVDTALDRHVAGRPGPEEREVAAEGARGGVGWARSEEHTSELQSRQYLVCRLLLEKKKIYSVIAPFLL